MINFITVKNCTDKSKTLTYQIYEIHNNKAIHNIFTVQCVQFTLKYNKNSLPTKPVLPYLELITCQCLVQTSKAGGVCYRALAAEAGDNGLVYELSPRWSGLIPLHRTSSKTPAPNLFLIGCNYARTRQDAKKTNRVNESRWKVDQAVLYRPAGGVYTPAYLSAKGVHVWRRVRVEPCSG